MKGWQFDYFKLIFLRERASEQDEAGGRRAGRHGACTAWAGAAAAGGAGPGAGTARKRFSPSLFGDFCDHGSLKRLTTFEYVGL